MDARITFALDKEEKKELDAIAHQLSAKQGKTITNGELIRKAVRKTYRLKRPKQEMIIDWRLEPIFKKEKRR